MKLNLGCGSKKIKGWINCDFDPLMKPDCIVDLNKRWPFKDSSIGEIRSDYLFEHVLDINHFISEAKRVLKRNGKFSIRTVNFFFWRIRLGYIFGNFSGSTAFFIYHTWLFKPTTLVEFFRAKGLFAEIKGKGILPFPDLFYYSFEIKGHKRED